jgi:titin
MKQNFNALFALLLRLSWFLALVAFSQGCNSTGATIATVNSGGGTGTGTTTSAGQVSLSWTAAQGSPQGYLVEQSTDGVNFSQIKTVSNTATSTTITGLTHGQLYYFRMRSYNQTNDSSYTSIVTATP